MIELIKSFFGIKRKTTLFENQEINIYQSGTIVLKETYTTKECITMNTNPIIIPEKGNIDIWVK